jgi:hypothetical protein
VRATILLDEKEMKYAAFMWITNDELAPDLVVTWRSRARILRVWQKGDVDSRGRQHPAGGCYLLLAEHDDINGLTHSVCEALDDVVMDTQGLGKDATSLELEIRLLWDVEHFVGSVGLDRNVLHKITDIGATLRVVIYPCSEEQ